MSMRTSLIVVLTLAAPALAGCVSARQAVPPSRTSAAGTVEMFKLQARRGDTAGEWDILSPGLKQRLSQQAGRRVDLADYMQARTAYRSDPQVRMAERMLQSAIVVREEPAGPDTVYATIRTGGGPIAQTARIRMVRLTRWQLFVHGQAEPYVGWAGDSRFEARRMPDGGYEIWSDATGSPTRAAQIPAAEVRDYREESLWYVDDLGGLEGQFM